MAVNDKSRTRNYDLFKGAIALGLLIIIAILLLQGRAAPLKEKPPVAVAPAAGLASPAFNALHLGDGGSVSLSGTGKPGATIELWAGNLKQGNTQVECAGKAILRQPPALGPDI